MNTGLKVLLACAAAGFVVAGSISLVFLLTGNEWEGAKDQLIEEFVAEGNPRGDSMCVAARLVKVAARHECPLTDAGPHKSLEACGETNGDFAQCGLVAIGLCTFLKDKNLPDEKIAEYEGLCE